MNSNKKIDWVFVVSLPILIVIAVALAASMVKCENPAPQIAKVSKATARVEYDYKNVKLVRVVTVLLSSCMCSGKGVPTTVVVETTPAKK